MLYRSAVKSIFLNQTIFEYVSSKTYQWKNQVFHFIDKNLNTTDFILVAYVYNTRIPVINTHRNKIAVTCRYLCTCV